MLMLFLEEVKRAVPRTLNLNEKGELCALVMIESSVQNLRPSATTSSTHGGRWEVSFIEDVRTVAIRIEAGRRWVAAICVCRCIVKCTVIISVKYCSCCWFCFVELQNARSCFNNRMRYTENFRFHFVLFMLRSRYATAAACRSLTLMIVVIVESSGAAVVPR